MIEYKGERHRGDANVRDGRRMGLWWGNPGKGVRSRRQPIRAILLHHQGGEGGASQLFNVLNGGRENRRTGKPIYLSVHFSIDREGNITQHADVDTVCLHAGIANEFSVGIEMANRGVAPALRGVPREVYSDSVHGRKMDFLRFFPAQVSAAYDLCIDLCDLLNLPWEFPMERGRVTRRLLSKKELTDHRGLLGHLHVSRRKIDPSPHLLDELQMSASLPEDWSPDHGG